MAMGERETVSLIGSDKVEGTSVYGADEQQIGSIERVMIQAIWEGFLRGAELRRLSWYRGRSLSASLGIAQV